MQTTTRPLMVQDVLSVFSESDRSDRLPAEEIYVELLTSDGLTILRMHALMASELMESLSRALSEFGRQA